MRTTFPRHRIATACPPGVLIGSRTRHSILLGSFRSAGATKKKPPLLISLVSVSSSNLDWLLPLRRGLTMQGKLTAYRRKRLRSRICSNLFPHAFRIKCSCNPIHPVKHALSKWFFLSTRMTAIALCFPNPASIRSASYIAPIVGLLRNKQGISL